MIKNQQDFWSGLMFIGLGALFAYIASSSYTMGTAARMGPGFLPYYLGLILIFLGGLLSLNALRGKPKEEQRISRFDWDILFTIIGSLVVFAIILEPLGFYIAILALVVLSSMASHEFNLGVAIGNALFLLLFAYLAFIRGLKLVLPLHPQPFSEWAQYEQILIPLLALGFIVLCYIRIKQVHTYTTSKRN